MKSQDITWADSHCWHCWNQPDRLGWLGYSGYSGLTAAILKQIDPRNRIGVESQAQKREGLIHSMWQSDVKISYSDLILDYNDELVTEWKTVSLPEIGGSSSKAACMFSWESGFDYNCQLRCWTSDLANNLMQYICSPIFYNCTFHICITVVSVCCWYQLTGLE